jgi:hypothetical protein
MLFFAFLFFGRSELFRIRVYSETPHTRWLQNELIPCINSKASLSATGALVPHLATRPWVHDLPQIAMTEGRNVGCVIYDSRLDNWPMTDDEKSKLGASLQSLGFKSVNHCDSVEVFESPAHPESCLSCVPNCPVQ